VRRTPYNKRAFSSLADALAARGFVVLVQDVRGRFGSAGEFSFNAGKDSPDFADGYDTVEWAAGYERSDGQVGIWGHSYDAWTAWRGAAGAPPHLGGHVAAAFAHRAHDVAHGIFDNGRRLQWYYAMAVDSRRRAGRTDGPLNEPDADRAWTETEREHWLWHIPLETIPEPVFAGLTEDLRQYLRDITREQYAIDAIHPTVNVPVFVITGWWDRMLPSIDNYSAMVARGTNAPHRLLVGPWGHRPATYESPVHAAVDFGPESVRPLVDLVADWYDHLFKGIDRAFAHQPPVELFVVNKGWQFEATWPPERVRTAELHLHSAGHANGSAGDGRLDWRAPGDEPPDQYDYDPRDPVPSLMGPDAHWAPYDQAPNNDRPDKLVYRTEPLEQAVEMIGPLTLELWAASDAFDTDWVARLIDEPPEGPSISISHGILRARYRAGFEHPELLEPGHAYRFEVPMSPVGAAFPPGHRIRLDVTSSDFPNYDRNHNTGRDYWSDAELRTARQTIFHDYARPSFLQVPLVDG
jgi:putative CocE/NonD family hydrolase